MVEGEDVAYALEIYSSDPVKRRNALLKLNQALFERDEIGLGKVTAADITPEMEKAVLDAVEGFEFETEVPEDLYTQRDTKIDDDKPVNKRVDMVKKITDRYGSDVQANAVYGSGLGGVAANGIEIKFSPLGIDELIKIEKNKESEQLRVVLEKIEDYKAIQPKLKQLSKEERELFDKYVSNGNKPSDVLNTITELRQQ
jgi:hypothetical protein